MTKKKLHINHVFGCVGRENFLINLKTKATGRLVDAIVKTALGAICSSMPMEIQQAGEKFVPAKSSKKRMRRKNVQATIERAAAQIFKDSNNEHALLLGPEGEVDVYSYDSSAGLVLDPGTETCREQGTVGTGTLYAKAAENVHVDVGCELAASLEVAELRDVLPLCPAPKETAIESCPTTIVSRSSSSSSSTGDDSEEAEKAVATPLGRVHASFYPQRTTRVSSSRQPALPKVTLY